MAEQPEAETQTEAPQATGWWESVKRRGIAMRNALLDYLPTGIIMAGVMVGGATAIGHSGMLGETGTWLKNSLGADSLGGGVAKTARIVGIGLLINGGMSAFRAGKKDSAHTEAGSPHTAAVRPKDEQSPTVAMQQQYDTPGYENPNQALPHMAQSRGVQQPQIMT